MAWIRRYCAVVTGMPNAKNMTSIVSWCICGQMWWIRIRQNGTCTLTTVPRAWCISWHDTNTLRLYTLHATFAPVCQQRDQCKRIRIFCGIVECASVKSLFRGNDMAQCCVPRWANMECYRSWVCDQTMKAAAWTRPCQYCVAAFCPKFSAWTWYDGPRTRSCLTVALLQERSVRKHAGIHQARVFPILCRCERLQPLCKTRGPLLFIWHVVL
jgi:hypothetical protein